MVDNCRRVNLQRKDTSGRLGPATAKARICPARMEGYAVNRMGDMTCDRPSTVSAIAGARPLNVALTIDVPLLS